MAITIMTIIPNCMRSLTLIQRRTFLY